MVRVDRLGEDDWAVFCEIRLRSLLDSPDAFGSTYGEESSAFYGACGSIERGDRSPLCEGSRLPAVTMTKELR